MNKIKKLISALVCMAMLCAVLPCVTVGAAEIVASGECGDNLTWTLDSDGVLTISGTGDMTDWGWYSYVPWLGKSSPINMVVMGSGVTSIGGEAFRGCSGLTSVTIPDSVTSIGDYAFCGCIGLTSVTIPIGVTTIGEGAFAYCESLTSVSIGNSVTSIGDYAFCECGSLTSVSIPDSVTTIGLQAFGCCTGLTSINVSEENQNYTDVDGVLFTKDVTVLVQYPIGNSRTEYNIPDSVTEIGDYAFYCCSSLTSVTIPDSVTTIDLGAFCDCKSLTSVTIGNGVTSIGYGAFFECSSLTSVTIPIGVTSIEQYAFFKCESLTDVYYSGSKENWDAINISSDNDCLISATIHYNSTGPESAITVIVDGTPIVFDVNPIIIEGSTMLPVRKALEPLGAEFEWDVNAQTVTVNNKGKVIVLTIGSDTALIDGAEKKMARPAVIIDGRTLIPIRFVAEELGYNVSWDNETKTVRINSYKCTD